MTSAVQSQTWEQIQEHTLRYLYEIAGMRGVLHMCKNPESAIDATTLIEQTIQQIEEQKIISEVVATELQRLNDEETKKTIKQITEEEGETFYLFNKEYCEEVGLLLQKYLYQRKQLTENLSKDTLTTLENLKVMGIPIYEKFNEESYFVKDKKVEKYRKEYLIYKSSKYFSELKIIVDDIYNNDDWSIDSISSSIKFEETKTFNEEKTKFNIQRKAYIEILNKLDAKYFKSPLAGIDHQLFDEANKYKAMSSISSYNFSQTKGYKNLEDFIHYIKNFELLESNESIYFAASVNLLEGEYHFGTSTSPALHIELYLNYNTKFKDMDIINIRYITHKLWNGYTVDSDL